LNEEENTKGNSEKICKNKKCLAAVALFSSKVCEQQKEKERSPITR
jgi:hypothetical protein